MLFNDREYYKCHDYLEALWNMAQEPTRTLIHGDDAENNTSKSHSPRTLLMAPAQQEETILVEGTGVGPAKCSPKIKSELFSLL